MEDLITFELIPSSGTKIANFSTKNHFNQKSDISEILGPFIRGKIRRVLNKTRTFRINGTFRLK